LGGHTASLVLCCPLPGFPEGMANPRVGEDPHGSWNLSSLSGYKAVSVPSKKAAPPARLATS
jgi:hypothetical protein